MARLATELSLVEIARKWLVEAKTVEELREKSSRNLVFDSMSVLENHLEISLKNLNRNQIESNPLLHGLG